MSSSLQVIKSRVGIIEQLKNQAVIMHIKTKSVKEAATWLQLLKTLTTAKEHTFEFTAATSHVN